MKKTDFQSKRGDNVAERPPSRPEPAGRDAASRLEADRVEILATYERVLDELGSPAADDPVARRQLMANAERTLSDIIDSLRTGNLRVDPSHKFKVLQGATSCAAHDARQPEPPRTDVAFFDVVQQELVHRLGCEERSWRMLTLALRALYQSMTAIIGEGVQAHEGYLLDMIHKAQVEERQRIGRDLHDRVGLWLSTAHRQLELYDLDKSTLDNSTAENRHSTEKRITVAYDAIREAMRILRAVTSELRFCEQSASLEKALLTAFEAMGTGDATVQLKINGDQIWASPEVQDEAFLLVREAVRNAVVHGNAESVLVRIDIAPCEMRIHVDDDGVGFDPHRAAASGGLGLSTMRERAELIGGTLHLSSAPGRGTQVELHIPLPGSEDDSARGT